MAKIKPAGNAFRGILEDCDQISGKRDTVFPNMISAIFSPGWHMLGLQNVLPAWQRGQRLADVAPAPTITVRFELVTCSAWAMVTSIGLGSGSVGGAAFHRSEFYVIRNMKKSITVIRKKRGRPATGQDPVSTVRLPPALKSAIDKWSRQQVDKPTRSEAIRRLIELALAADLKSK